MPPIVWMKFEGPDSEYDLASTTSTPALLHPGPIQADVHDTDHELWITACSCMSCRMS